MPPRKRQVEAATDEPRYSKRARSSKTSVQQEIEAESVSPAKRTRRTKVVAEVETTGKGKVVAKIEETENISPQKSKKGKAKINTEVAVIEEDKGVVESAGATQTVKKKRKTKEEKEAEAMPLAARTTGLRTFIGAHVSAAGGEHT